MTTTTDYPFVKAARELGPSFAERAVALDRSGAFARDNYADMKARGLFSAAIPTELGGGGASYAELCAMLRELAHHCPSTALALSMHTQLAATTVWKHRLGQPGAALLEKVAAGKLVLVSTGAGDWVESNGSMEKVDGGYRVSAVKRFGSGSPAGDIALTSARYDDPERGPMVAHFPVPLTSEGVTIADDWDTLGMRATGSQTITYDRVFVPDDAIGVWRPAGWHPMFNAIATVALPLIMSVYVGVAEQAAVEATTLVRGRPVQDHTPYLMGEMGNALSTAQLALGGMIDNCNEYDFAPELERGDTALRYKTITANASRLTVEKAVEVAGGAAFFRTSRLEQLFRDVQAGSFHPLPEKKQLLFSGRVALGIDP
jgi:alkylation response protein AidB-like acyl-CoA dehydrogenase